jgi:hypothetical protein
LLDVNGVDVDTARATIFQVNVEGQLARTNAVVVVTEVMQTALTWVQVGELTATFETASWRFA